MMIHSFLMIGPSNMAGRGELGDFLSELETERHYYREINRQIRAFAAAHPMTALAFAENLAGKPDHLHFTARSQREFGLRYYAAFRTVEPKDRVFEEKPNEDDALRTYIEEL